MCSNFCPSSIAGHLGSVNDVDFHKVEPIILSASSDKQIYLGEFDDAIWNKFSIDKKIKYSKFEVASLFIKTIYSSV